MKLRALAKINLGLDVTGKREDGYHEVRMVMQTIQMYDQLEIKESKEPGIRLTTNLPFLPCNDGNLVYKAAKILMDEFDIRQGVDMNLTKFIPVAAGMAGGSSDAAAALVGINRMFQLGLTKRQLMERGVQIGADVPYCVMRGTALAEGIGEKLTSLPGVPMCYVLIGKPGINPQPCQRGADQGHRSAEGDREAGPVHHHREGHLRRREASQGRRQGPGRRGCEGRQILQSLY